MLKRLLPLIPAGLLVRQILPAPGGLVIVVASRDRGTHPVMAAVDVQAAAVAGV